MTRTLQNIRPVLLQVREAPVVAAHERECFLERCGFDPDRFKTHNLVDHPNVTYDVVADADVVFIGGAAAHSVTERHEFTEPLAEVVFRLIEESRPLFGSCWGHQFMAQILGGEVRTEQAAAEVGSFQIHLTPTGHDDPVFTGFPEHFMAHMGHHDSVMSLPQMCVELAYSARCRNQVFRVAGKPAYGTQFHAEMSAARLIERLEYYRDSYIPSDGEFEELKQRPLPTPEADRILHRFLEEFVGA